MNANFDKVMKGVGRISESFLKKVLHIKEHCLSANSLPGYIMEEARNLISKLMEDLPEDKKEIVVTKNNPREHWIQQAKKEQLIKELLIDDNEIRRKLIETRKILEEKRVAAKVIDEIINEMTKNVFPSYYKRNIVDKEKSNN